MSKFIEFILLNIYLLAIILVGAMTLLGLGSLIMATDISNQSTTGFIAYTAAAIISVMTSYYFGKITHPIIERLINK